MSSPESDSFPGNVTVVLVEPHQGGNIGSVARAMMNMGLRRLALVRPQELLNLECKMMAGKALALVEGAAVHATLEDAVAAAHLVIGTSSTRDRKNDYSTCTPREAAAFVKASDPAQKVALVFGPEPSGLTESHLSRCRLVVRIPASSEHPVLNLSQAVMILAYELFNAASSAGPSRALPAPQEEWEGMCAQMEEVLVEAGFLSSSNPEHIMSTLRRVLLRCDLTSREVRILRGVLSQISWYGREGHRLPSEKVVKP